MSKGGSVPKIESHEEITGLRNPITWYKSKVGTYPSNVQTWWSMKRPVMATPDNLQKSYLEAFDPDMRKQITYGNTLAPKGHYIVDAFHIDRSKVSGVGGLETETTKGLRPKHAAFYAGRIFYAGAQRGKWNSRVYFSQILERHTQAGDCHQQQDPTSEDVPDLLPSDGGVIVIPEIAEIVKMYHFGSSLFLFATNGVWQIGGSDSSGFKANDYTVSKISMASALGPHSFVETDGGLLWWSRSSIWMMAPDQTGLSMNITSITDPTIKDYYNTIPDESKKYAKGAYNKASKIVQWIFRQTAPTSIKSKYRYNRILNLDTRTGAFYPWRPMHHGRTNKVRLSGIIAVEGDARVQETMEVWSTDDTEQVVVAAPADVYVDVDLVESNGQTVQSPDTGDGALAVMAPQITYVSVENKFKYLVILQEEGDDETDTEVDFT